jgi:diphthine-ammonia ligase
VNDQFLLQSWLGREIDNDFVKDILKLKGIDPCAENGEYHSFVYNGPLFKNAVLFLKGKEYYRDNHWFLELD